MEYSFLVGRHVRNPFEKIHICTSYDIADDPYLHIFLEQYRRVPKREMVWVENFREDTRQWRMTYDPFQNQKILQTYGKKPPKSFKIR